MVNSITFHPDGNCLGVGTTDNVVKVLAFSNYMLLLTFISSIRYGISGLTNCYNTIKVVYCFLSDFHHKFVYIYSAWWTSE